MTPDEKKVLAEMLGLVVHRGRFLKLSELKPNPQHSCDGCVFLGPFGFQCNAPKTGRVPPCGDKIFIKWKPKP